MITVGVDVSKLQLDWAAGPESPVYRARNDRRGIRALVAQLVQLQPERIILESTGGYERPLLEAWRRRGFRQRS
jgi:transposase